MLGHLQNFFKIFFKITLSTRIFCLDKKQLLIITQEAVGIDVIGNKLTEINVTSPTGIREINQLMGTKLECDLTNAVESKLAIHRQRGLK